jgi:hypothetical protein
MLLIAGLTESPACKIKRRKGIRVSQTLLFCIYLSLALTVLMQDDSRTLLQVPSTLSMMSRSGCHTGQAGSAIELVPLPPQKALSLL